MAKKFFKMMAEQETRRTCSECTEPAIAWIYRANQKGGKNLSSRVPVCRKHLVAERPNL